MAPFFRHDIFSRGFERELSSTQAALEEEKENRCVVELEDKSVQVIKSLTKVSFRVLRIRRTCLLPLKF